MIQFGTTDVKYHLYTLMVLIFITLACHRKLANLWRFGGMVDSTTSEACCKHVWLKTLVFYYGWCPTKTTVLQWVLLYFRILCTFSLVGIYIRLHFILLLCLNLFFSNECFCAFYDCVEHQLCPNLCLASVESMVFIVSGENKRCENEACNIWLPLLGDVHVHQLRGDHWIV